MSDLAEIRGMLADLQRSVGRIEGGVTTTNDAMKAHATAQGELEKRVRKVENRQHWYAGLAAALGAVLGIGGSHGMKL